MLSNTAPGAVTRQDGVKREKTETDSGWDGTSPNRDDAVKHVLTPRTNATTESEVLTQASSRDY